MSDHSKIENLKTKKLFFLVCFLLSVFCSLHAQDIHLTQFFTNPLIISPASTGYFKGNYRVGFNYKYQWPWATTQQTFNYHTQAVYADVSFLENKVKRGWMGIGVNFLNDAAGDGNLRYMRFGGSIAWHQAFDKENRFVASAGFVVNYIQKTVDFEKFYFNTQWVDDQGFDRTVNSQERPSTTNISQIDMGFGVNFNARINKQLLLGSTFSMLHINKPKDQFYSASNQLGYRYVASVNAQYELNRSTVLQGNVYFTTQKKAWEVVFGGMVGLKPQPTRKTESVSTFYAGIYYRFKDALAPIVGYQIKQTRLLINYDVLLSKLSTPGKLNGGLEISFVHVGSFPHKQNERKYACPTF